MICIRVIVSAAEQLVAGTVPSVTNAEQAHLGAPTTSMTDNSPLIMISEDSTKPHVLCISPHGGVVQESQMDLLFASSASDDEERPDDCERGALHRCLQRLKMEKMKNKFLQIQLAKSQVPLFQHSCVCITCQGNPSAADSFRLPNIRLGFMLCGMSSFKEKNCMS
jgi:hypothetical protein